VLGALAAGPYLGLLLGPVIGGIVQNAGRRALFLAAGAERPTARSVWGLEWNGVPRRSPTARSCFDAASLPALLWLHPDAHWAGNDSHAGLLGLSAFLWWRRGPDPLLNLGPSSTTVHSGLNPAAFVNYVPRRQWCSS
jgi:hypothetical protein